MMCLMKRVVIKWYCADYHESAYYISNHKWTSDKSKATSLPLFHALVKLRMLRKEKYYDDTYSIEPPEEDA